MINNTTVENKHTTTDTLDTVYPITFEGATDAGGSPLLKVTITDSEEAVQNLVYNIDYVLVYDDNQEGNDESLNEPHLNGIKLIRAELAIAGNSLTITRNTPFVQPIDFQIGRIDPEQVERVADLSVLRDQELRNQMVKDESVIEDHENRISTAEESIDAIDNTLSGHLNNLNNPHQTSIGNLTDTNINAPVAGQFIMFDGVKWKNVYSSATASWGAIIGNITDQTDLMNKFTEYVRTDGTSVMTNPLMMRATDDFKCAIAPYWDGVGFFKLNDNNSVTLMASIEYNSGFEPATTNTYNIGALTRKWKNLYLSGKAYISVINNGYDIAVPAKSGTLATMGDVDLAANSGDQLTEKGVWYAKMYSATVAPSAEDGTNYADFSQTDGQGNPIIVIYKRQNGAWVQDQTITPPAEYNGYVPVTSKIWDIVEQAGQQGGKVLWSHSQKTFTPSPLIISFESINVTGNSTVVMPATPTDNSIPSKKYIDDLIANLDVPELFDWKWKDCTTSRTTWALSDGEWITDKTDAYQHLVDDRIPAYCWRYISGDNHFYRWTLSAEPEVGDALYKQDSDGSYVLTTATVSEVAPDFSYIGTTEYLGWELQRATVYDTYLSTVETVAGTTIRYYQTKDGHKIVDSYHATNADTIYTATGVAWYYILDTANQRFKLPRTKHSKYADNLGVVGTGISLGLTNGTYTGGLGSNANDNARLLAKGNIYGLSVTSSAPAETQHLQGIFGVTTDPEKSGIIAQQIEDTDQYKYLYFYVGN